VTLRCRPLATATRWGVTADPPDEVCSRLHAPSAVLGDDRGTHVRLDGHPDDVDAQVARASLEGVARGPALPEGRHRGRASVRTGALAPLTRELRARPGCRFLAEHGVGTVHVATDDAAELRAVRAAATKHGGWLIREAGGDADDGFGTALPDAALHRRLKLAFDPEGRLNPGRLPL
jgi:FAD/FMN-containing dehydrogenase